MKPVSQTSTTRVEAAGTEKFNLQLTATGQRLRVQLQDPDTQDKKHVRIGNVTGLDWLWQFIRRG